MTATTVVFGDLRRRRTEWAPWLAVIAEVVHEIGRREWDAAVPSAAESRGALVPGLAGAAVTLHAGAVRRFLERLIRVASRSESPKLSTLRGARAADLDVLVVFAASVRQDTDAIAAAAARSGVDAEALQAVAALLSVPFLHACARRFTPSISPGWVQGYCPVCGSWPAFAEVRGIERTRAYRCGRCGAEWHARALCCPYCEMIDHDELVALVPQSADLSAAARERSGEWGPASDRAGVWGGAPSEIAACNRCRGYVKTFMKLQGCLPVNVMVEDLGSVELDVAALEQGYARPAGAGYDVAIHVTDITDRAAHRRLFHWNS